MSLPVTEDTPPDMLAGSMDLNVVLPNGKNVKMSIQRSTPMMDLLVQVTTAHRLSPGNHALQAMGDRGVLPYKPSTPIGTLDAFTIKIVDKKLNNHKKAPQVPQTFLNTFRLQVNLPRSQLFVTRVTPDVTLAEILTHICTEKNLDINKYEFRNPGNSEEVLELDKALGYYKIQELSLVNKNNRTVGGLLSSADILHVKSSKHRQNSVCDSSLSSGSLGSRSTSPVPVNLPRVPPQPPIRKKRRPAPKPPQCVKDEGKEETKTARSVLISHSRESSDSSGYHEASVLSESPTHNIPLERSESNSPPDTLPRHSKLLPSQSFTNLTIIQPSSRARLASSVSNASLNSNGTSRKKRPPPPPPISIQTKAEEKMKSSTLPTSRAEERIVSNVPFVSAENGRELSDVEFPTLKSANTKVENVENTVECEPKLNPQTKVDVEIDKSEAKSVVGKAKANAAKPSDVVHCVNNGKIDSTSGSSGNEKCRSVKAFENDELFYRSVAVNCPKMGKHFLHEQLMSEMISRFKTVERSEYLGETEVTNKPVPKPRKLAPQNEKEEEQAPCRGDRKFSITRSQTDSALLPKVDFDKDFANVGEWNNINHTDGADDGEGKTAGEVAQSHTEWNDNLKNVKSASKILYGGDDDVAQKTSCLDRWRNIDTLACLNEDDVKATKTAWLLGDSEASGETSPTGDFELNDHDSLNWQYQLPPPPTDFRDTNSPNCTEFGTITITPDIYKEETDQRKETDETDLSREQAKHNLKDCRKISAVQQEEVVPAPKPNDEVRLSHKKSAVMGELTNVRTDGWKIKEKSSSISNLCSNDSFNSGKGSGLSYSKSFSNELPTHMKNLNISACETLGSENNRNDKYKNNNNIKYENYKNLEKSLSMECIRIRLQDECEYKSEEAFRKPIAPIQKKLKMAKRSSSTMGVNNITIKKKSDSDIDVDADPDNIAILRQHFLEFLKEKNLNNDLSMKSLNVIRHILPKINGQIESETTGSKLENNEVERSKVQKSGLVKVIDFKKKGNALMDRDIKENVMIVEKKNLQNEMKKEPEPEEKTEAEPRRVEPVKRYSYHAPPSINFATWGERPKTQVFIKDEDYVTEEKVTKKMETKPAEETQKPIAVKKPGILQFKKPGVKSRYEMFSALPKKKEVTSLSLVQMEDEERKKKKIEEGKEASRMPVVCGVELKKEFKERQSCQPLSITEVTIKPEAKPTHSVSIYINGNQRSDSGKKPNAISTVKPTVSNFTLQKRSCTVMPVVKGFRTVNEPDFYSHVNINKICNINSSSMNGGNGSINIHFDGKNESGTVKNQKLRHVPQVILPPTPPPPPPPASLVSLKPVSARQQKPKFESQDQRDQLLRDIRNFAGFGSRKLRTAQ